MDFPGVCQNEKLFTSNDVFTQEWVAISSFVSLYPSHCTFGKTSNIHLGFPMSSNSRNELLSIFTEEEVAINQTDCAMSIIEEKKTTSLANLDVISTVAMFRIVHPDEVFAD